MPWLITALGSLFTVFVNFFVTKFSYQVAWNLAKVSLFVTFTIAFILIIKGLIFGLSMTMPDEMRLAIGWFMPSNMPACLSAYFAAQLARFVYDTKYRIIKQWSL